jgi:hypothetical protein
MADLFPWREPFRWRTNLRILLPVWLAGRIDKGEDCGIRGGTHDWYNMDNVNSACYHCEQIRPGQLWKSTEDGTEEVRKNARNH